MSLLLKKLSYSRLMPTVILICQYLEYNRTNRFTYRQLRTFFLRKYGGMSNLDWHTIERNIRKLAESGYLHRLCYNRKLRDYVPDNDGYKCKKRMFEATSDLWSAYREWQRLRGGYRTGGELIG